MWKLIELLPLGSHANRRKLARSLGQGRLWRCMALAAPLALTLFAAPAWADAGASLYWQCVPPSSASPNGGYCPTNQTYRLPTNTGLGGLALAGTQAGLSIAAATALTVPTGATLAVIQAQGTNTAAGVCLFWRDDGTNPTNAAGQALAANASITYAVQGLPIKMIAASGATCTATISYYK